MPAEPIAPGVWRLVLPTPYAVGPVNAYLLLGSEPTLIDAGRATPEGVEALVRLAGVPQDILRAMEREGLGLRHGDPVRDPGALVSRRLQFYQQLFLVLSETVGYLDLLEEEGLVGHRVQAGVHTYYRVAGRAAL